MINIGILSNSIKDMSNFEYRFFYWAMHQDWIKLKVLFLDGRVIQPKNKLLNKIFDINIISKLIFMTINKVDDYFINYDKFNENNKKEVINWLTKIEHKKIYPLNKLGNIDYFNNESSNEVKAYNLDLIIRFSFNIISGEILNASKNGIWSFHHADNDINRGGPAGFWEVFLKQTNTGVTLQRLSNNLDGGDIIDKAFYVTQSTFKKNNAFIIEKSLTILIKNLNLLKHNRVKYKKSKKYNQLVYKYPKNIIIVLKYFFIIINNIFIRRILNKFYYLLNYKLNHWVIYISDTNIFNKINIKKSIPLKTKKNIFYADPFHIAHNSNDYIFYEKFDYKVNKGILACSKIKDNKLLDEKVILEKEYHLSYPFIFKYKDLFFLLPEMSYAKKQDIYISTQFPYEWKLHKTIFKNVYSADPTIYQDDKDNFWLFISQSYDPFNDLNSELYLYKINNLNDFKLTSHLQNPIIIDSRKARSAGNIFKFDNQIIRPSQNTNSKAYGNSLNFNKIIKLNINEFEEEYMDSIKFKDTNIIGTHHFSLYREKSLFDVCFRKFKWNIKKY